MSQAGTNGKPPDRRPILLLAAMSVVLVLGCLAVVRWAPGIGIVLALFAAPHVVRMWRGATLTKDSVVPTVPGGAADRPVPPVVQGASRAGIIASGTAAFVPVLVLVVIITFMMPCGLVGGPTQYRIEPRYQSPPPLQLATLAVTAFALGLLASLLAARATFRRQRPAGDAAIGVPSAQIERPVSVRAWLVQAVVALLAGVLTYFVVLNPLKWLASILADRARHGHVYDDATIEMIKLVSPWVLAAMAAVCVASFVRRKLRSKG